jgi:hypothetical protein
MGKRSCGSRCRRYNQAVPRPLSKSALESLGRRLVASDQPEQADIEQLHVLLAAYGPVLGSAVDAVAAAVGQVPSSRVKNTVTINEKLRRNGGHTLGSMQDLGGMRLVVNGGRDEQDRVAEEVWALFADEVRAPRLIDRRVEPTHGYRAVHVIVYPDGYPLEVQVRTQWQHLWAEWFERLADQYGRGIRYGEPPVTGGSAAQQMVNSLITLADQLAESEESGSMPPLSAVALALADGVIQSLSTRRQGL